MTDQIKIGDTVEFTDAYGNWQHGEIVSYDDDFGFYNVHIADDKYARVKGLMSSLTID